MSCVYISCTTILENPWEYSVDPNIHPRYQPIVDYTYEPVLGSLNTWSIIQFTNKIIDHGDFDEVHKVVIDSISDNMASLAQVGKYGAISA